MMCLQKSLMRGAVTTTHVLGFFSFNIIYPMPTAANTPSSISGR